MLIYMLRRVLNSSLLLGYVATLLGVLALSKEVILGVNLRAIECLIRCIFI